MRTSLLGLLTLLASVSSFAQSPLPSVEIPDWQPFAAQVRRLTEALTAVGAPLSSADQSSLDAVLARGSSSADAARVQELLDRHALVLVEINPEMRVKARQGPAPTELVQQGWRVFLVKVVNESGTTAELRTTSPQAVSVYQGGSRSTASDKLYRKGAKPGTLTNTVDAWLDLELYQKQPLKKQLSGLRCEYTLLQIFSRDAGKREAKLAFDVGQGTQDLGFRNEVDILFDSRKSGLLTLKVRDEKGSPTTASFTIRDANQRVYPALSKRLAPDFGFHPQVYRADGETVRLPAGNYEILCQRGPEYLSQSQKVNMAEKGSTVTFKLERWIDPTRWGWWSGDHHIHAAGCAHYTNPTEGVHAPDMMRHCLGEDLKVGCNLTWGPCFDYQKQFFTGRIDKVSKYPYLLRYDVEVSGFGSHASGHLCLLRLQEQMYPGGTSKDHWPTLGLNTLRWAKKQGAVVGPAHSGWGLQVATSDLPNYVIPPLDGIGANEYLIDVTHEVPGPDGQLVPAVDFMSMVDTPYVWELNMWYHTLNCGFRTRISGETDFPCIYGERVGLGRSYVKLGKKLDFDAWCQGIREGRNYVSDGKSHLIEVMANGLAMGEQGSEIRMKEAGSVTVEAVVAARLDETPDPSMRGRPYQDQPYWELERSRVGTTRQVPVELIVNGYPVAKQLLLADGHTERVKFQVPLERSSWIAIRILPSSHSNPFFVLVGDKPIRASRRSAEWCLKGVDQCWGNKEKTIRAEEHTQAVEAYEHARMAYRKILAESDQP